MSVGEYEEEPVRGLPGYLPADETLIWQGEPDFKVMARRVFHVRTVALYFAALIVVHLAVQASGSASLADVILGSTWMVGLGILAIGILSLLAFAYARTTVYTLTDKRLVLRFGVAMPMMVNIPLSIVTAADLRRFPDGSGDIVLSLEQKKRLSYMMLWPNVRSWRINPTQPALRSIANVDELAASLASVVSSATKPARTESTTVVSQNSGGHNAMIGAS
ncbi:photosynthetic complex putative assembly protein PuhB [Congregibacter variabilis]|uniref:Photosynthetic complex putative assembly protein PuhB n=1 Tax=Congregibacter variabilis TaxID=3081200 RepID=A0ABZ0I2Z1_9GAMM|nr:photosynthetic complex putative assembly protein PuhB [Congregibacter sp. IMCC43200]